MIFRKTKPGIAFIIALLSSLMLQGQILTFTLKQAQDYAVQNSYDVKNAQFELAMAERKVKENLSYGFPQIDGSLDYNYFISLPTSLIPAEFMPNGTPGEFVELQFGTKNNLTAGATLNQLIFDGRYFVGLEYAKIFRLMSEERLEKSGLDVKETVTSTYYNILVGEQAIIVLDSTLKVLEKTRFETGEMFKEGFAEQTDYDQLTLTVMEIQNAINSMQRQNEVGYLLLKFQMGINLEQPVALAETLEEVIEKASVDALLDQNFNLEQHVDYRLISTQEKMKVLSLKNERAAYYPKLNGFLSVSENAQRNEFDFTDPDEPWYLTSITGFSMQVPIFSSGYRRSRVIQAKLDIEKIQNVKLQVTEGLKLSVSQSRSQFKTALENYIREKENVELSLEIYRKSLAKYSEGIATSIELTQQHNQFFEAERRYFQTALSLLNAKNSLDKALGNY
jgi:outer membrane protein TolC